MEPKRAYYLALEQGPANETRKAACQNPWAAYRYARDVDQGPRDDTRTGACQSPLWAYEYAYNVDKGPRDDTRAGAGQGYEEACCYACHIDKWLYPILFRITSAIDLAMIQQGLDFD